MNIDTLPYGLLGFVKEILDKLDVEVTYVYEDLVFIKPNHFLLQFSEKEEKMII